MFSKKMLCAYGLSLMATTGVQGLKVMRFHREETADGGEVMVSEDGQTSWQVRPADGENAEQPFDENLLQDMGFAYDSLGLTQNGGET